MILNILALKNENSLALSTVEAKCRVVLNFLYKCFGLANSFRTLDWTIRWCHDVNINIDSSPVHNCLLRQWSSLYLGQDDSSIENPSELILELINLVMEGYDVTFVDRHTN